MKPMLNRILSLLAVCCLLLGASQNADAQKKNKYKYKEARNYEVVMLGVGSDGTKVFKIYATDRTVEKAIALAKMAAIEVTLFRGLPARGTIAATPRLCDAATREAHAEYFEEFFQSGGRYLQYLNVTTDGIPSGQDRLKVKGGYKVGLGVQVLYDNLREDLEADGIIRPMDYGF